MLGTAGHVDHGKTALVKLLTGCQTDRLATEQKRGLTIEVGFAPCRMADERIVGVVDVPGHVDFIRNMVAGAHGVDVVIFVIAADDGVMPQTREHLDILTLMGCRRGLVALTKIDLVDQELRDLAAEEVRQFTEGTFLAGAPICPISNTTGEGFEALFAALNQAVAACEDRPVTSPFKLWIERSFSRHGFGAVVTGIPSAGQVGLDQRLRLAGSEDRARVRRLEVYGVEADVGRAGECVAMNLTDVDPERLRRGGVLTDAARLRPVRYAEAELRILPQLPAPVADYLEVHVHIGTAEAMANLAILNDRHLPPGELRLVQLRFRDPLPVSPAERFVIRGSVAGLAGGRVTTLGGGTILDATDIRLRRNRPWTNDRLQRRAEALTDPIAWTGQILRESDAPAETGQLAESAGMRTDVTAECLESLRLQGTAIPAGDGRMVHRDRIVQLGQAAAEQLRAFCQEHPLRLGLSADGLAKGLQSDPEMVRLALDKLVGESKLLCQEGLYRPAEMSGGLGPDQLRLCGRIEQVFRDAGLRPPSIRQLAEDEGVKIETAEPILTLLVEQGRLVDLGKGIVMHRQAVARGREVAVELFAKARGFTTMDFRDALGVSRKYAVPLLDHLDATRWTVRTGNRRRPGALARCQLED